VVVYMQTHDGKARPCLRDHARIRPGVLLSRTRKDNKEQNLDIREMIRAAHGSVPGRICVMHVT